MKTKGCTPAAMIKKHAKEIINLVNEYQAGEKMEVEARNVRGWDEAQTKKSDAASEIMVVMGQMLSELGCVLSIEGLCGATEYYVIEKKNL